MTISAPSISSPDVDTPSLAFEPAPATATRLRARLFWPNDSPTMTGLVETFGHFGLTVVAHQLEEAEFAAKAHRLVLAAPANGVWDAETGRRLAEVFAMLGSDRIEVDGFLRLVTSAGLRMPEVVLIRALSRYAAQCGLAIGADAVVDMLADRPCVTSELVDLFTARLEPGRDDRERVIDDTERRLDSSIALATTLDEDRLFRALRSVVRATLRTNYFRPGIPYTRALVLKLDPAQVELPAEVVPHRELFVHSATVEGSHVRGGTIARGGLRHSERPSDFRTEVLGLLRTQIVKNSLIVPVGAKGAFVARGADPAPDRVRSAYAEFVSAMLDVTDNLVDDTVVHPDDTVVTDGPDPYLVVAADKGTARFSDLANGIAVRRGFWLGDAFASGGSAGYDHKKMGITARGTWVAVRRHLSEVGIDVDTDEFTAAGIGDMSGDVFGNGMLASTTIRLIAAFDHRHIFLDPTPDATSSYFERQRLFHLPTSSWDDYDRTRISPGGGVWSRAAKSIPLSDPARRALDVEAGELSPHELIAAILRARVDLLFNGGVGTYVKASTESHAHATDSANDALRVDADTVRARAIGEGGNLGLTQRARVEYALAGGRINGDFIDNAAGVATSDREVNLKIALEDAVRSGAVDPSDRDAVLAGVTDEVAAAVLADCDRQTLALSLAENNSSFLLGRHARLIDNLEETVGIDRTTEVLPTAGQLAARIRDGGGLVRPEIAVLLAMSKNLVRDDLLASPLPDDPAMTGVLAGYFPAAIRARLEGDLAGHRVAREIVAVSLANDLIDHVGPGFVFRAEERFGVRTPDIVRAYVLVSESLDVSALWRQVIDRDDLAPDVGMSLLTALQSVIEEATGWVLRQRTAQTAAVDGSPAANALADEIARLAPTVGELRSGLPPLTGDASDDRGTVDLLGQSLAIADEAIRSAVPVARVAQAWRCVGERFDLDRLAHSLSDRTLSDGPAQDHWEAISSAIVTDQLAEHRHALVRLLLAAAPADQPMADVVDGWARRHPITVDRLADTLARLHRDGPITGTRALVAVDAVRLLIGRTGRAPSCER
ncbi:NAD-glutamate dehydrogenase domain-containing protein [Gordonia sp. SL306]|uniref:NAD-glutamate dehydrogenase domain-containing protein n=1 Tax=Gordonia sp. SL306 TaxID=2995145 RepID=UPI002270CD66|nr:NAD-glutamate dehydrogenase domain-containing protein [Gordonia sp. SL306]WAC54938.1 NAD-glutamate dehydrogenase [Gordonia sp. SL306]